MTRPGAPTLPRAPDRHADLRFRTLRLLANDPGQTQRSLSRALGASLGTVNALINRLIREGLVEIRDARTARGGLRYSYALTVAGTAERVRVAPGYLHQRRADLATLRQEIETLEAEIAAAGPHRS